MESVSFFVEAGALAEECAAKQNGVCYLFVHLEATDAATAATEPRRLFHKGDFTPSCGWGIHPSIMPSQRVCAPGNLPLAFAEPGGKEVEDMETMKACVPDLMHSRIEDIVNAQTVDEEIVAHMRELDSRLEALQALARDGEAETARGLAEEVQSLYSRIRRDFVAMAYRQGLIDGGRLREIFSDSSEKTPQLDVAP